MYVTEYEDSLRTSSVYFSLGFIGLYLQLLRLLVIFMKLANTLLQLKNLKNRDRN